MWVNAGSVPGPESGATPALEQTMQTIPALLAIALALPGSVAAQAWDTEWNLRLRHEHVGDDAFAHSADASTARLRAGLRGKFGNGWETLLEAEAIAAAGDFNDGGNGRVPWPAVSDPEGVEINQAWLRRTAGPITATAGRQRLLAGDQRWPGTRGRSDEHT